VALIKKKRQDFWQLTHQLSLIKIKYYDFCQFSELKEKGLLKKKKSKKSDGPIRPAH